MRCIINDDDAFEILDYLIFQNNSYAQYIAQKLFISMGVKGDYIEYARSLLIYGGNSAIKCTRCDLEGLMSPNTDINDYECAKCGGKMELINGIQ